MTRLLRALLVHTFVVVYFTFLACADWNMYVMQPGAIWIKDQASMPERLLESLVPASIATLLVWIASARWKRSRSNV